MKKIAHIGLGILKLLGLIVLVMVINGIPMLFLAKGQNLPIYTEILLVLAYLVLVFCYPHFMEKIPNTYLKRRQSSVIFLGRFWKSLVILFSGESGSSSWNLSKYSVNRAKYNQQR